MTALTFADRAVLRRNAKHVAECSVTVIGYGLCSDRDAHGPEYEQAVATLSLLDENEELRKALREALRRTHLEAQPSHEVAPQ